MAINAAHRKPYTPRAVTRKPNPAPAKQPERAITPRVAAAIEGMTFRALSRKEAAQAAGITESALYQALRKPAVMALFHEQMEVLRKSARAKNFHALEQIRDTSVNDMAKVAAIKVLEPPAAAAGTTLNVGISVTPGYVIDLRGRRVGPQMDDQVRIAPNPLIEHEDVGDDA